MSNPPATYPVTLADLMLFAESAGELDSLKNIIAIDRPVEAYRIGALVERMHETIARAAGADAFEIYGADETCIQPEGAEA